MLEVLTAHQVLLHLRMECPSLFSQVNPCLQTLDLTCSTLFIVTAFFVPEKLRESFYIWSPDLPRALPAKTGEKSHLRPKSQISAHLPTLFLRHRVKLATRQVFFVNFWDRMQSLTALSSLSKIYQVWVCVLVFVERFLV